MNRRGFLKALAGLPLVGVAIPKAAAAPAFARKEVAVAVGITPGGVNNAMLDMTLEDYCERFLDPALAQLAERMESDIEADRKYSNG